MLKKVRKELILHIKSNIRIYVFLIMTFVTGICAGAFTVNGLGSWQSQELRNYVEGFMKLISNQNINYSELFKMGFTQNLKLTFILWLLGATVIGIPFIFILIGIRGFVTGFTSGFIIGSLGGKGVIFVMLTLFPKEVIIIPCLLCLSVCGINFSLSIIKKKNAKSIHMNNIRQELFKYSLVSAILIGFISLGVLMETYVSTFFSKLIIPIMIN